MSRYFTSPPPVYARNWANGQNLVESTKIIERQVVPPCDKVHRKEKKVRKKEKKIKNLKSITQLYLPTKKVSDECEQVERSCLTEEHEQPLHVGYLSDGSQNSRKRRKVASPVVESSIKDTPVASKPLRIRFVFKKPKEPEVVVPNVPQEEPVCSISGTDRPTNVSSSVPGHDDKLLSTPLESDKAAAPSESKKKKKHRTSKESRYSSLFDEPVLPCISLEEDDVNNSDDWLISERRQEVASPAMSFMNEEHMQKTGDSCFPRSQFLPEVEIFSLPYTVLF